VKITDDTLSTNLFDRRTIRSKSTIAEAMVRQPNSDSQTSLCKSIALIKQDLAELTLDNFAAWNFDLFSGLNHPLGEPNP